MTEDLTATHLILSFLEQFTVTVRKRDELK